MFSPIHFHVQYMLFFLKKTFFKHLFRHLRGYTECWGIMFKPPGSPSAPWLPWKLFKLSFIRGSVLLFHPRGWDFAPILMQPWHGGIGARQPYSLHGRIAQQQPPAELQRPTRENSGCSFNVTPPPFLPPFRQLAFFEISLAKPANVNRSVLGFVCFN